MSLSLNTSVQESMSNYNSNYESLPDSPTKGFCEKTVNPDLYIRTVKKNLANNGLFYSYSELETMRDGLKKAYSHFKGKKNKSLLSEYRSSLATITRLSYQAKETEKKTLDEIMDDKETNLYQKFIFSEKWVAQQNYSQLHSEKSLESIKNSSNKLDDLVSLRCQYSNPLTDGEQRAYSRVNREFNLIKKSEFITFDDFVAPVIEFPKRKEESLVSTISPKEPYFKRFGKSMMKNFSILTFIAAVGCAAIAIPSKIDFSPNDSIAQTNVTSLQNKVNHSEKIKDQSFTVRKKLVKTIDLKPKPVTLDSLIQSPRPIKLTLNIEPEMLPPGKYRAGNFDTCWRIAERFYDDPYRGTEMCKANGVEDPRFLKAGTVLDLDYRDKTILTMSNSTNKQFSFN